MKGFVNKRVSHGSSGFAMLAVLGFVLVITILSTIFFENVLQSVEAQQARSTASKTYHIAESGIHHAVLRLSADDGYGGEQNVSFGDGAFSVFVTPPDASGAWIIESVGKLGNAGQHRSALRATVTKSGRGWETLGWERIAAKTITERDES